MSEHDHDVRIATLEHMWIHHGRAMNLTGDLQYKSLAKQIMEAEHVVELARILGLDQPSIRWLDVGSGAGFPGLVIAARLPVQLVMIEPRAKRASFLEHALARLGRSDVSVLRGRLERGAWRPVEKHGPALEGPFDIASARAVFEVSRWAEEARPWLVDRGIVVLHQRCGDEIPPPLEQIELVEGDPWQVSGCRFT